MTAAETSKPETATATEYVVLVRGQAHSASSTSGTATTITEGPVWREAGKSSARSADAAIREVVGKLAESERKGTFVAIPSRSFKPVTVSEKVERTLVIGT